MRPSSSRRLGSDYIQGHSYAHREGDDDEDDDARDIRNNRHALEDSTAEGAESNAGSSYTTETVSISAITQDSYFQSEATVSSSSSSHKPLHSHSHSHSHSRGAGGSTFLYPFTNQLGGQVSGSEVRLPRHHNVHAVQPYESEDEPSYQERHHTEQQQVELQLQQQEQQLQQQQQQQQQQQLPLHELHHQQQRHTISQQTSYYGGKGLDLSQDQPPYPPSSYRRNRRRHSTIEEEQEHVPQQQHFPLHQEEPEREAPAEQRQRRMRRKGLPSAAVLPPIATATTGHQSPANTLTSTSVEGSGGTNSDGIAHSSITTSLPSSTGATNSYTPTMSSVSDSLSFHAPPSSRPAPHHPKHPHRRSQDTGTGSSGSVPQAQQHGQQHQGFKNFTWKSATSQNIQRVLSGKTRTEGSVNNSQMSYSSSSSKSSSTKKPVMKSEESASTSGGSSIFSLSSFRISVPSSLSSASRSVSTYSTSSSSKSDPLERLAESEDSSPPIGDEELQGGAGVRKSTSEFISFSALPRYARDSSGSTITNTRPQKPSGGRRQGQQQRPFSRGDSASTSASSVMDRQVVTNNEQRRKVLRTRIFNRGRRPSFSSSGNGGDGNGTRDHTGNSTGSFGSNISNHKHNSSDDLKKRGHSFSLYDKTASTSKLSSVLSSIADVSDEGATSSSGAATNSYNTGSVAGDYYPSNSSPKNRRGLYHDGTAPASSRSGDSTILRGTSSRKVNFRLKNCTDNRMLAEEAKLDMDQEHYQSTIVSGASSGGKHSRATTRSGSGSGSRSVRSSRSPLSGLSSGTTGSGGPRTSATMAMSAYQNRVDAFIAERQGRLENERMLREAARIRIRAKRHASSSAGHASTSNEEDPDAGEAGEPCCCCHDGGCKWNPLRTKIDACITIAFVQALLAFVVTILYFEVSVDDVRKMFGG